MTSENTSNNNQAQALNKTVVSISDIMQSKLYINWFIVCDSFGNIIKRPKQENSCFYPDFDQDIEDGQKQYDQLKEALIFPDFYIDDQIGVVSLLRNDKLQITITVINIDSETEIKFIEAETLGELLNKFPKLKQFIREDILSVSEC
jgi:hypothetical protein